MMIIQHYRVGLIACLVLLAAGAATALTVDFATSGIYTMSNGGNLEYCSAFAADGRSTCRSLGLPDSTGQPQCCQTQARWGDVGQRDVGSKSGLGFSGMGQNGGNTQTPPVRLRISDTTGTPTLIGVNTHYNYPVGLGSASSGGIFTLSVFSVQVNTGSGPVAGNNLTFTFPLTVDETFNSPSSWSGMGCPYTTVNAETGALVPGFRNDVSGLSKDPPVVGCTSVNCSCSDRIYFDDTVATSASGVVRVGGSNYTVTMAGFSDFATYLRSDTSTSFISQEGGTTVKYLFAALTIVCQCPVPKITTSNEVCDCQCPATDTQSQADCPNADYLFNANTCRCVYLNNDCANQRLALSPLLDAACEAYTCVLVGPGGGVSRLIPPRIEGRGLPAETAALVAAAEKEEPSWDEWILASSTRVAEALRETVVDWQQPHNIKKKVAVVDSSPRTNLAAFSGSVWTLNVTRSATGVACRGSSPRNSLCSFRCQASGGRSSCVAVVPAPVCSTSADCRRSTCTASTGQCLISNRTSGSCVGAGAACTNYACNSAGICIGTTTSCAGGVQIPDASDSCRCKCPAGSPTSCSAGFILNTTACACQQQSDCSGQLALIPAASPIDSSCESVTCAPDRVTLVYSPRINGSACSTSANDRCTARCVRYTDANNRSRASCDQSDVSCPAAQNCRTSQCRVSDGICTTGNQTTDTECTTGADTSCWTYACDGSGTCRGTDPCPDARQPDSADGCICKCPVGSVAISQANCAPDFVFQASTCTCLPSNRCDMQLAALIPPLDNACEQPVCTASVLTIVSKASGTLCDGTGVDLCNARCRPRVSVRSGAFCEVQPVVCAATTGCSTEYCDTADGVCRAGLLAAGSTCSPTSTEGCTRYTCSAAGNCVGEYLCELDQEASQLECREYTCDENNASRTFRQCIFAALDGKQDCDSSACSAESSCVAGDCKSFAYDCASQEAVDAQIPGAIANGEDCTVRICRLRNSTAVCDVDYFIDDGSQCTDSSCRINSKCDGAGECKGERDPQCADGGDSRRAEIIGSAAAGGTLAVVGGAAIVFAAAGSGLLAWWIRRRNLMNFDTWNAGPITGATISPLYIPDGAEHVNPLSEL